MIFRWVVAKTKTKRYATKTTRLWRRPPVGSRKSTKIYLSYPKQQRKNQKRAKLNPGNMVSTPTKEYLVVVKCSLTRHITDYSK